MERHFTVTGFVVHQGRTVLHWHQHGQMWLPPGGHVEPDEDPVTALRREVREETGLEIAVVSQPQGLGFDRPQVLPPPFTILLEDSYQPGPRHQHIDLIYFCRVVGSSTLKPPTINSGVLWVDQSTLMANRPIEFKGCGIAAPVPAEVRELALRAIQFVRDVTG